MTNLSLLTATAVFDQLVALGVRDVFFSPGSRSAPFVYSIAGRSGRDLIAHVRLDERSAAFHALGAARATGLPAVVITTSGSAVGNLMPAVLEADHSQIPLVVLTADRPPELRGTGANQTTRQPGIFGDHVRAAVDIALAPEVSVNTVQHEVSEALAPIRSVLATNPAVCAGPVHLNVAFREPLHPDTDLIKPKNAAEYPPLEGAPVQVAQAVPSTQREYLRNFSADLPHRRSIVLAADGAGPAASELAEELNLPLCAEPSSNARRGEQSVGPYRFLLDSELGRSIERVILVGRPTLSRPVARLLARPGVRTAAWQPHPVAWYQPGRRREQVITDIEHVVEFVGHGESEWTQAWKTAGIRAHQAIKDHMTTVMRQQPGYVPGLVVAQQVWRTSCDDDALLVLGASNPIRDMDVMAGADLYSDGPQHPAAVIANRGLAGIDGTIGTAFGAALATGRFTRLLLGDLTFLHDAGSLLTLTQEQQPQVQIVVVDDRGGGIFNTLEHGQLAQQNPRWADTVERFFGTEPSVNIPALCQAYGVKATTVQDAAALPMALGQQAAGVSVVVVRAQRQSLHALSEHVTREASQWGVYPSGV